MSGAFATDAALLCNIQMATKANRVVTHPSSPVRAAREAVPEDGADFNVAVKIRNGRLLRAIRQAGYSTTAAFARAHGIPYQEITSFVTMTLSPFMTSGKPRPCAQNVADILKTDVESLFPPQFIGKCLAKTARAEVPSLTEDQVAMLIQNIPKTPEELAMLGDVAPAIERGLKSLPPRVEHILRLRFALGNVRSEQTLDEIAKLYDHSRERVRQIENRGLRLLKRPARARELARVAAPLGVFPRQDKDWHISSPPQREEQEAQEGKAATLAKTNVAHHRREQEEQAQKLNRRVRFPDDGPTRRQATPENVIRERTNAPPPGFGVLIGTPGVDEWVDLRGVLVPDKGSAAVVFHRELVIGWTDGRFTPLPPGSYIVPRWALKNVPDELVLVRYASCPEA